jgi:STE24 endopeptidase
MNYLGITIILLIIISFLLKITADFLNLSKSRDRLPENFKRAYKPEKYRLSIQYLKTNTKFSIIVEICHLLVVLIFWLLKGFQWLDHLVRGFGLGPVISGLIYIGSIMLMLFFISLPFSIYKTFAIEEKYGFNRTEWKTFLLDGIKGIALTLLFGVPLVAAILAFFEYCGFHAWWLCWIFFIFFVLFVQYVSPTWVMPLFNKFEPLEPGSLKNEIIALSKSIAFPVKNIVVMDGSKRSNKSNAFFTGFGKSRRIVLYDTLVEKHNIRELLSILAHEMGHYKKMHIFKSLVISGIHSAVMFYLLSLVISKPEVFEAFYVQEVSVYAGLVFFGILFSPVENILNIFFLAYSRKNEYEADRFSVQCTGDPKSLISGLIKLSTESLSNLAPHPMYVMLHYSHPPIVERIKRIESSAAAE